ncbi:MAG: PKD domain-containing protein [Methanocalculus sp.]|uniref:PKD domain-containing protein n=1 Tax=Methanocalculus sp. TaxID=2004547 RepID=UPI00271DF6CD|nr:PKD domain-containing protein [Methanocalculus sp.]MDO9540004.1 PKD domain-containing protein [Methanocalculus sp.]
MPGTDGVSEVIGSIMLISLVVLAVVIVGVGILSQPPPVQTQYLDAIPGIKSDTLYLYHNGGDALYPGDFFVRVDGIDYSSDSLSIQGGDWPWEIGELLKVDGLTTATFGRIQIISTIGGQQSIIVDISDVGMTPVPTTPPPTPAPPVANFFGSPTSGTRPLSVVFTDTSTRIPTSWSWSFGDGNTSTAQNPTHTYVAAGTYTVSLTATNAQGSDTETKTGYITVSEPGAPPVANFTGTPTSGTRPLSVVFTDTSTGTPTSWSWTFGDGNSSTLQNPTHQYVTAGIYTVTLTATNAGGSDTETKTGYITVSEPGTPPVANFTGTPTSGTRPLSVVFTDNSTGTPTSWSWSFGDGSTSTAQNPTHTYVTAGTYTVSLTATNANGSNTVTKTNYITINEPTSHNILLNSNRPGTVLQPGYLELLTTLGNNYVDINNVQYSIGNNAIVRLTINSDDTSASIYGNGGRLTTFTFTDVTLSVNGVTQATGAVTAINIRGSTDRSSTLVLISPAVSPTVWTRFDVDGVTLINGQDGRKITLFGIVHNTAGEINLNRATNYYVFRSAYVTDPPL